jgi:hypothetical protein
MAPMACLQEHRPHHLALAFTYYHPLFIMSSNPNTRVAAKPGSFSHQYVSYGTRKQVTIGSKDSITVNILAPVSPSAEQYERAACFDDLISTIRTHRATFPPSDFLTFLNTTLPLDTTSALQSATSACHPILQAPFNVANLEPRHFLNRDGHIVKVDTLFDSNRPADLFYVSFDCIIDGHSIDQRIRQPPHSLTFCIRLPQTTNHSASSPTDSETPRKTLDFNDSTNDAVRKSINEILQEYQSGDSSPAFDDTVLTQRLTAIVQNSARKQVTPNLDAHSDPSPKMAKLFASADTVTSYFGPLNFADDQVVFFDVFGPNPPLLHVVKQKNVTSGQSIEDAKPIQENLQRYLQQCKLDIFIELCRSDYVGDGYAADSTKAVSDITKKILNFSMLYQLRDKSWKLDTPNDLYSKFLLYVPSLPEDPGRWNLVLCITYYNALTDDLQSRMEEDKFVMPNPTHLHTKEDHLRALRVVRDAACTSFSNLQNQEKLLARLLNKSNNTSNRHGRAFFTSGPTGDVGTPQSSFAPYNAQNHAAVFAYTPNRSQAETTLQRYSPGPAGNNNNNTTRPSKIPPSLIRCNDGLDYPYDPTNPSNISDYPIGHKGCLCCGSTTHQFKDECPHRFDRTMREKFWNNMWLHYPHTKRRSNSTNNTPNPSPPPPSGSIHATNNFTSPAPAPIPASTSAQVFSYQHPQQSILRTSQPSLQPTHEFLFQQQQLQQAQQQQPIQLNEHQPIQQNQLVQQTQLNLPNQQNQQNEHVQHDQQIQHTQQTQQQVQQFNIQHQQTKNTRTHSGNSVTFQDHVDKRSRLFIQSAVVLNQNSVSVRQMPLDIDNGLPGIEINFGSIVFLCHADSCAAMNTGNKLLHQWIVSTYPDIVVAYEEFNDPNPFEPLGLQCAVSKEFMCDDADPSLALADCLTAVVTYRTAYTWPDGSPVTVTIGLGDNVAVKAILGKPLLKRWKADIRFSVDTVLAHALNIEFPIEYAATDGKLPSGVQFIADNFVRPTVNSSPSDASAHATDRLGITDGCFDGVTPPLAPTSHKVSITETTENGILKRVVEMSLNNTE